MPQAALGARSIGRQTGELMRLGKEVAALGGSGPDGKSVIL